MSAAELLSVKGEIRWQDGFVQGDLIVRAFDKDLRHEEELGRAVGRERYEITYDATKFRRAEKGSADLIVRAYSREGVQLAESEIMFNARAEVRVDLIIEIGHAFEPSEFEALMAAVSPVLDGVRPADLTDADLAFLVGETGLDRQWLDFLRRSAALNQDTGLPTAAFYGWGRESLPLILTDLLDLEPQVLRQSLASAIDHNIVPARLRDQVEQIMRRL